MSASFSFLKKTENLTVDRVKFAQSELMGKREKMLTECTSECYLEWEQFFWDLPNGANALHQLGGVRPS